MAYQNKEQALKVGGIEVMFDVFADRYHLRRIKPAEHMSMTLTGPEFERLGVSNIYNMFDRCSREQDDYVHLGPTNKELRDPRIRNAWEEFVIIKKLIGVNNGR